MYQFTDKGSRGIRTASVDALRKWPETRNTDPNISFFFFNALLYIAEEGNVQQQFSNLTLHSDILGIGWPSIILGFITKYLARIQQTYFIHIGSKKRDSNGPSNSLHKYENSFTENGSTAVNSSTQDNKCMITLRKWSSTQKS